MPRRVNIDQRKKPGSIESGDFATHMNSSRQGRPFWDVLWKIMSDNLARFHSIPVLMYHQVVDRPPPYSKFHLYVTVDELERQFQFLRKRGFEPVTFSDLMTRELPSKPVFLTFDDGYENNHRFLFPMLKRHKMRAVLYILGDRRVDHNFWDVAQGETRFELLKTGQIREMSESGLVEFGAHSMRHDKLTVLSPAEVARNVGDCKRAVEAVTGRPVFSLAYPYGYFNDQIKAIAAKAGYVFGLAVNQGPLRFGEDLFAIRRIYITSQTSLFDYRLKTSRYYFNFSRLIGRKD